MTSAAFLVLVGLCAPRVATSTMLAVIAAESAGDPLALGVNGAVLERRPRDIADAVALAQRAIDDGHSVDLGLMQINSKNLPFLGLTIEQALDPCTNLRAGSQILERLYTDAARSFGAGQRALRAALSAYNTGDYSAGFANGYVARVAGEATPAHARLVDPYRASTTVFSRSSKRETKGEGSK